MSRQELFNEIAAAEQQAQQLEFRAAALLAEAAVERGVAAALRAEIEELPES